MDQGMTMRTGRQRPMGRRARRASIAMTLVLAMQPMAMGTAAAHGQHVNSTAAILAGATAVEHATGARAVPVLSASLARDLPPALVEPLAAAEEPEGWLAALPYFGGALLLIGLASRRLS